MALITWFWYDAEYPCFIMKSLLKEWKSEIVICSGSLLKIEENFDCFYICNNGFFTISLIPKPRFKKRQPMFNLTPHIIYYLLITKIKFFHTFFKAIIKRSNRLYYSIILTEALWFFIKIIPLHTPCFRNSYIVLMPAHKVSFFDTCKFRDLIFVLALDKGNKRNFCEKIQKYIIHVISTSIPPNFRV